MAVSSSHAEWFLLNASPDLRMQIVGAAELDSGGRLRDLKAASQNTNPILDKDSPQYREVREAGWDVAEDGWEFTLRRTRPLAF